MCLRLIKQTVNSVSQKVRATLRRAFLCLQPEIIPACCIKLPLARMAEA